MRRILWISSATLICLVAAVLVIPHFVDLGIFKGTYLPLFEEAFRRRVDVGEVRLSLIPTPSIRLSNLKVSDSPAFPGSTFFAAEQLRLRLKLWPLLRGRFEVTEFVLEKPVVNLLKRADGTFNYSDLADKKTTLDRARESKKRAYPSKPPESAAIPLLVPSQMRVRDGQLNFQTMGQKAVKINGIDLSLQEFSGDRPFPYRASFSFPGLKLVALEGMLDYQEDDSTLQLNNTRLRVQELVLPVEGKISNLSSVPTINLTLGADRVDAKSIFQILSAVALAPSDMEVSGPTALRITMTGPSHSLVTQVRGQFKGVKVQSKRLLKGIFSGEVFIKLPLGAVADAERRLQGNGNLMARDGELTNLNLVNKLQRAAGLIGLSPNERRQATTFNSLEASFVIADGLAEFRQIDLTNPQAEMSGNGTMTLAQPRLNIAMKVVLSAQASARAGKGRTVSVLKDSQGRVVVPLKITGPVENPSVDLDSSKVLQRGSGQLVEKGFGTFFKQLFRNR
jgi:uncharacterized protein involved in outer membrane biogenesis